MHGGEDQFAGKRLAEGRKIHGDDDAGVEERVPAEENRGGSVSPLLSVIHQGRIPRLVENDKSMGVTHAARKVEMRVCNV